MIVLLKFHLLRAQTMMKQQADKVRSNRVFQVGDWVWLKLQPYMQQLVTSRVNHKLASKFYGSFQIVAAIGVVAYNFSFLPRLRYMMYFTFPSPRLSVEPSYGYPRS